MVDGCILVATAMLSALALTSAFGGNGKKDFQERSLPAAGTDDAKRPYEMVWAGRSADANAPALVDFTDPKGWQVDAENAVASFARSTEHLLFGDGVSRLVYRASGKGKPRVRLRPASPIPVGHGFDTVSCWIYGNNHQGKRPKGTPVTTVFAHFVDAKGEELALPLARVRHLEWCKFQSKLPREALKRFADGGSFTGLSLENGTNREDRQIEFCSLCVFKEKLGALSFAPRARRGVQIFREQPQGINTGKDRLPFPKVDTTIVPVVKPNPDIEFRMPRRDGSWDELAFRYKRGPWVPLAKGGGVWPCSEAVSAKTRFKRIGDSVVADISVKGGRVEEVRFGGMLFDEYAKVVPVPYYTYKNPGVAERPTVISATCGGTPVFVSASVDWTQSNASELFSARHGVESSISANGGVIYSPKTDGRRNDVYERFVWTVSTNFASVLPVIPNPPSPWKHVTGACAWRSYGAKNREKDSEYWRKIRRMGIRHVVVTDHETGWRDNMESFTFRTEPAPQKGGNRGQYDYARYMIDDLGFRYGPYNNFTDFAPVNEHWHPDHVQRLGDGSLKESWARCYSPKPLYAVEMCERLTPIIQGKFNFNTAYCDVHTAVTPWARCDYDNRVPGAGTFAQTFYAYGEIMLIQKRNWQGPVYSEGGMHWMYCGLTDGNYAQDQYYDLPRNPWLVDFDLLRMHPLCCNFGVGSLSMFYGEKSVPSSIWDCTDPFVACTVAFGHPPFLLPRNTAYSYFMLQALAAKYTLAEAKSIRYADESGRFWGTSEAVSNEAYRNSQIKVGYSDGTEVAVNGSSSGKWLAVPFSDGKVLLPPYGFVGVSPGVVTVNASKNGRRIAYSLCDEYVYMCARERKWIETPGGGTDGELIRLRGKDGVEEVIVFNASRIVLPYAAKSVQGLADKGGTVMGDVQFSVDSKSRTHFKPVKGCYSYRVVLLENWREPSEREYLAAAFAGKGDRMPTCDGEDSRLIPIPYHWRSGMILRNFGIEEPIDSSYGARMQWNNMIHKGVVKKALSFHPPYRKAVGSVFASYTIKVPKEGLVFSAKVAKAEKSVVGDGILFRVAVREKGGDKECVAELTVKNHVWNDISADLSRWAGRTVELYLIADPGAADNTNGDGGGWTDMKLEVRPSSPAVVSTGG